MYIRWIPTEEKDIMFLSPKTLENFGINSGEITLHLGAWKEVVRVRSHQELDENTIGFSEFLFQNLTVPDFLPYDVYLKDGDLFLGPVIAVVVRKGKLSQQRMRLWTDYCRNYSDIRGLIYFCRVHGIDKTTKTIKGFYYNPEKKQWILGKFPYPGVVYQRTRVPEDILRDLKRSTNNKVFNARLFTKWQMWRVLTKAGFTHTPYTALFNNLTSLRNMLNRYPSVYLKPSRGRFGLGIQKVEKEPGGYLFKKEPEIEHFAENLSQVFKLIKKHKKKRKYIIQQSVSLLVEGKLVDFRVILQKDSSQEWSCSGMLARMGYEGWIYTNTTTKVFLAREALQVILGLTPEQALEKEDEIVAICTKACQIMEHAYGILGDVGFDVVVDRDFNIWILEINKVHEHTMVKRKFPDMYHKVITRPFEYAKALAGFCDAPHAPNLCNLNML